MSAPGGPVESREQPSGEVWPDEDFTPWPQNAVGTPGQIIHRFRTDPYFRGRFVEAAIDNQATAERCFIGFHAGRIEEMGEALSETRATIRELRAEAERWELAASTLARYTKTLEATNRGFTAHCDSLEAERDRARSLAAGLASALERTRTNFVAAVRGTPVRDMAETLAECDAALAAHLEAELAERKPE